MKIKLNGWQRIGVVLNAIYLIIIIIIAWYEWPTQKQIESSWVYSALDAIRKPESPSAYELMEGRFKNISDRELIKRINLEYNANKVRGKMPNILEMLSDFRNLDKIEQDKVLASNTKVSEIINAFNGLPKIEQDKVVNHYSSKPQAQSEAQPQSPGGKPKDIFDRLNPQQPSATPRSPDFESMIEQIGQSKMSRATELIARIEGEKNPAGGVKSRASELIAQIEAEEKATQEKL